MINNFAFWTTRKSWSFNKITRKRKKVNTRKRSISYKCVELHTKIKIFIIMRVWLYSFRCIIVGLGATATDL